MNGIGRGILFAALAGCAPAGTGLDDMSADDHRRASEGHEALARQHEQLRATEVGGPEEQRHFVHRRQHEEAAAAHRAAAEELERFEAIECRAIAVSTRAECPFLGHVASVEDLPAGVRVHVLDGESVDRAVAHMRCHLAFARSRGSVGLADCPLYMPGVDARPSVGGTAIDVTTEDAASVEELRRRMRNHVVL